MYIIILLKNLLFNISYNNYKLKNNFSLGTSKSFIKVNSQTGVQKSKKLDRLDSLRGSTTDSQVDDTFGPLSNVR